MEVLLNLAFMGVALLQLIPMSVCIILTVPMRHPKLFLFTHALFCILTDYMLVRAFHAPMLVKALALLLFYLGIPVLFAPGSRWKALFMAVVTYSALCLLELMIAVVWTLLSPLAPVETIHGEIRTALFMRILGLPLVVAFSCLILYFWKKSLLSKSGVLPRSLLVVFLCQSALVAALDLLSLYANDLGLATFVICTIALVTWGLSDVAFYRIFRQLMQYRLDVERRVWAERQLDCQLEHYHQVLEHMHAVNKMRHDIREQLQVITALTERGELEGAQEHRDKLSDLLMQHTPPTYCKNLIIDAVISEKKKTCEHSQIQLDMVLDVPEAVAVDGVSLCSVFSNLMENAIAACGALPPERRSISLHAKCHGGFLTVRAENSAPEAGARAARQEDGMLPPHGLGLDILSDIARRYEGDLKIDEGPERFSVTVWLKLSPVGEEAEPGAAHCTL